jgi:DNA (cytosine-5)-methyltransferase 1
MIGVDLFCGAGGMSLGAEWAGVKTAIAVDIDKHATATYKKNHPHAELKTCGIAAVKEIVFAPAMSGPLIVFGGPPCKGFSTSNQRTRSRENPANWLFLHYLRIVKLLKPDWVVFENVKGILETDSGYFFQTVVRRLRRVGYTVSHFVLNAADFGVPQRRWRLFVVGSLRGVNMPKPNPTALQPTTVRDAIWDLPVLRNGASADSLPYRLPAHSDYARLMRNTGVTECTNHLVTRSDLSIIERYRHISAGGNWADIPRTLMTNYADPERCHTGIYKRLKLHEPSVVIGNFRKNMLIHPTQNRGLSVREAARLQSFPDSFVFTGSIGFQQEQVGNAVPPMLAKAVFESILNITREASPCGPSNR